VTDGGAPFAHQKPARRRNRASSHFCDTVGSTVFCERDRCPYCSTDDEDAEQDEGDDRVATDGGRDDPVATSVGAWVRVRGHYDGGVNGWHASLAFDGFRHTLACGEVVDARDDVKEAVAASTPHRFNRAGADVCPGCDDLVVRREGEGDVVNPDADLDLDVGGGEP
jgi:hypothetical protein